MAFFKRSLRFCYTSNFRGKKWSKMAANSRRNEMVSSFFKTKSWQASTYWNACDVASPTRDSFIVVAVEIQNTQTAKKASGGDAVADSVGDDEAIISSGTAIVEAPKSLTICTQRDTASQLQSKTDKTRAG
jgi:hypothetical protein